MISLGNIEIAEVRLGGALAKGLYIGSVRFWPEDAPVPVQTDAVTFVANEAGATVGLVKYGSPNEVSLVYSLDGSTWSDYTMGQTFTLSNVGDMFCIRAKTTNSAFSTNQHADYYQFSTTGDLSLMGNINTLLAADGEVESADGFNNLFRNTTITDAGGFELPSVVVHANAYSHLFYGCSSMVVGPKRLPMLDNRAAGDSWPSGTYYHMFDGCSSLLESPVIDVEIGNRNTLEYMFQGCSSLRKITLSKATSWNNIATSDWVSGVAATGDFVCKKNLPDERGTSKIPEGWRKVDVDKEQNLKFVATSDGSSFTVSPVGSPSTFPSLETSTDKVTWTTFGPGTYSMNNGDVVYLRASSANNPLSPSTQQYFQIATEGNVEINGRITRIVQDTDGTIGLHDNCLYALLNGSVGSLSTTLNLDFTGISSVGQHAMEGILSGGTFNASSKINGLCEILSVMDYGMQNAFNGTNVNLGTVDMSGLDFVGLQGLRGAFANATGITKAVIGNTGTVYGASDNSTRETFSLEGALSSSSVKEIELNALSVGKSGNGEAAARLFAKGCQNLSSVTMDVQAYAPYAFDEAFSNCPNLKKVTVNGLSSTHSVGWGWLRSFKNCTSLERVEFPDLEEVPNPSESDQIAIGGATFNGCSSLTSISFPKLQSVGTRAFDNNTGSSSEPWYAGLLYQAQNVKELHFGANCQSTLSNTVNWEGLWDAPNPSQISVYCGIRMIRPVVEQHPIQVEYVMNTPNVISGYVDTGVVIDEDTSVSASLSGNCDGKFFFGTVGGNSGGWRFFNTGNADEIYWDCGSARKNLGSHTWDRTKWTGVSAYNNGFVITRDGDVAYDYEGRRQSSLGLPDYANTIHVLGNDTEGSGTLTSHCACGGLKVYKGSTLVMDLIPATNNGVAGFWDTVNETMIYPKNGAWFAGPEVGPINS